MARPRHLARPALVTERPPATGTVLVSIARPRADVVRHVVGIAFSAALHIGIALLFLLHWKTEHNAAPAAAEMMVQLAPLPSSPVPIVKLTPPGPQQLQAHVKPQPKPKPVKIPKFIAPPVMRGSATLPKLDEKPDPTPPSPDQPPSSRSTDLPATIAPKADAAAAPASGSSSIAPRTAEEHWEDEILAKLEKQKRYPGVAQMRGLEDVVYLRFTVDRAGHVLSATIDRSKGISMLDEEVLSLIHRVEPLPSPPASITGDAIEMVVPVEFFLKHQH